MTNPTITRSYSATAFPLIMAIMLGVSVLAVAGHAQSPTLHGAAHDTRHATGFLAIKHLPLMMAI